MEVVADGGADAVHIREIARQAGVHDSSIYRRWPTKEHLVFDALVDYNRDRLPIPDTGSLRTDLVTYLATVTEYAATPVGQAVVMALVGTRDDATMAAERARFWQNRIDRTRVMFDRAVTRGELPSGSDAVAALELLIGALYFRILLTRQPLDDDVTGHLVDVLVNGLAPSRSR